MIAIVGVEELGDEGELGEADARAAGAASLAELRAELDKRPGGQLYRIELRWAGPDPRKELAAQADLSDSDRAEIAARLADLDRRSRSGPWTTTLLQTLQSNPGQPSRIIAERLGRDQAQLKRQIRRLKDLGLTTSLGTGYELSPRARAYLGRST